MPSKSPPKSRSPSPKPRSTASASATSPFQQEHDRRATADTKIDYAAPTGALPPGHGPSPSASLSIEVLADALQLSYKIPPGTQASYHPNPGTYYESRKRRSFLPNTPEGRRLLTRYKYAFQRGHMLQISSQSNKVVCSSIPSPSQVQVPPGFVAQAHLELDRLGIPGADAILDSWGVQTTTASMASGVADGIEVSLSAITPIPPPKVDDRVVKTSSKAAKAANIPVATEVIPLPPPYLSPATPHFQKLQLPRSWSLSAKEAKKCKDIFEDDTRVVTQRHRTCQIPILASEIVIYVHVKDFANKLHFLDDDSLKVTRASRAAILTRGSIQLKKMPLRKTMALANVADRSRPNIKFGIQELRGVHMERDIVLLAYDEYHSEDDIQRQYAIYQTPEPHRFLSPLTTATVAAYVGVPTWAIPVAWSGNLAALQQLQAVSKQNYIQWMGSDGGFSCSLYAAALAYHVHHKLHIGKLANGEQAVAALIVKQQPRRLVPTPGPKVLDLVALAHELAKGLPLVKDNKSNALDSLVERANMLDYLVERGLHALAFNLVFRRLRLVQYSIPMEQVETFKTALAKALLYNVTLRDVDFSSTNLAGICADIGKSLAMNAQPLISRVNFSNCQLEGRDLRALLPGLARIWCGGTALMEYINFSDNPRIPTEAWNTFFGTMAAPSIFPYWPQSPPPPPPSCAFLQELDLLNTNAIGPGLFSFCTKLSGLRTLKISSFSSTPAAEASEFLFPLVSAEAPLETFVGKNLGYAGGALFSFSKTLRRVTFDGFHGEATPFICCWPQAAPKLVVTFQGKLSNATVSHPNGTGFAPGSLSIENTDQFGKKVLINALPVQATGLKHLFLTKGHYSQLSGAVPVLAFCGLETLNVNTEGCNVSGSSASFWGTLAPSTTLRDIRLQNQFVSSVEVAMVGRFLKTNRSVARIEFDGNYILDVESVKVLRSAFYGNKKVTDFQYLTKAHANTMADIKRKTQIELRNVSQAKADIKRIFKRHYSKYNRNWRAEPNRLKLPYVEKIRVAKRKIGRMQRDSAKIGKLLNEIRNCIAVNKSERAIIEQEKSRAKLARRGNQLNQLATKKKKFLSSLVTKLRKAKKRGREKKSAKVQVPRATYYKSPHMWPQEPPKAEPVWCWQETKSKTFDGMKNHHPSEIYSDPKDCWIIYDSKSTAMLEQAHQAGKTRCDLNNDYFVDLSAMTQTKKKTGFQRKVQRVVSSSLVTPNNPRGRHRVNSRYRYYNDPYGTRFHNCYGYYGHRHHHRYFDNDSDLSLQCNPEPDLGTDTNAGPDALGLWAWTEILENVGDIVSPEEDPWETVDLLAYSGIENLDAIVTPEFLADIHNEISELGPDVVSDLCGTLDDGAAICDKVEEISSDVGVPAATLENAIDSNLEVILDTDALQSTLGDAPGFVSDVDFEGETDAGDRANAVDGGSDYAAEADDAVGMYAGAGPRDLDDGGPSCGDCGNAALAGARRRARTRKENRKLKRAREKANMALETGYKSLLISVGHPINKGNERADETWPVDLKKRWVDDTKVMQIEAMAQSELLQLPDVSEQNPSLLVEWADDGVNTVDLDSKRDIEVILVTQCSLDRLPNLEAQLASWKGKASVAVYLKPGECPLDAEHAILSTIRAAREHAVLGHNRECRFDVAVTMIEGSLDEEPYPINYLRNVALLEARRQHLRFHDSLEQSAVLLVDVDFRASANLYDTLHAASAAEAILKSRVAVVCPAFESTSASCPGSIADLKECSDNGEVEGFHVSHFPQGHSPTRFNEFWTRTLRCKEGNPEDLWQKGYTVQYEKLFEPYVVLASRDVPLYDERFVGYGLNKVSHLASMARLTSNNFFVLPGVFLVAPAHSRSQSWTERYGINSDETQFNQLLLKGLYHNFMMGLSEGTQAVVSDQTRAKHCFQRLQEIEAKRRKEKTSSLNQLSIRPKVVALATSHSRA